MQNVWCKFSIEVYQQLNGVNQCETATKKSIDKLLRNAIEIYEQQQILTDIYRPAKF